MIECIASYTIIFLDATANTKHIVMQYGRNFFRPRVQIHFIGITQEKRWLKQNDGPCSTILGFIWIFSSSRYWDKIGDMISGLTTNYSCHATWLLPPSHCLWRFGWSHSGVSVLPVFPHPCNVQTPVWISKPITIDPHASWRLVFAVDLVVESIVPQATEAFVDLPDGFGRHMVSFATTVKFLALLIAYIIAWPLD